MTVNENLQIPEQHFAAVVTAAGGPEKFEWKHMPVPTPGPGEVLIQSAAAGLNFIETYQRSGVYDVEYPFIPGTEGSGTVVTLGDGVTDISIGDRVATAGAKQTYGQFFVAPADQLLAVPEDMDLASAAALPLQGMTAHYLCRSTYEAQSGDTALVHAGAGGVGLLLTQLLTHLGVTVYATASTDEKKQLSREAGAVEVFDYSDFKDKVLEATNGEGVNVAYDSVGKDTFDDSLDSVRVRGTLVLFGGASGQVPPFDLQRLNSAGSIYVNRPSLVWYTRTAEETQWRAAELFEGIREGWLNLRVGQQFELKDAAQAHTALESRATTGKTLLLPPAL